MKVYVLVTGDRGYEFVRGVFTTKEKANDFLENHVVNNNDNPVITECELDSNKEPE